MLREAALWMVYPLLFSILQIDHNLTYCFGRSYLVYCGHLANFVQFGINNLKLNFLKS